MNLIEQMEVLKGLSDEHLAAELKAPTGGAAPFMVASELARRKDMRQRYESEAARKKPSTTVVQDLMAQAPGNMPPGMGGPPLAPAAAPTGPAGGLPAGPVPGFASGGIVDAVDPVDYNDILKRYNERLANLDGGRDRAAALALLAASAGILGGGHSNLGQNLGAGIKAGVDTYSTELQSVDSSEMDLLRNIADLGATQHSQALQQAQEDRLNRSLAVDEARLTNERTPADILKFREIQKMSPEEKAEYERLNPTYNPNALPADALLGGKMDLIYQDAQKKYPIQAYDTPEDATKKQQQAQAEAYNRIKAAYGAIAANEWAAGMGLAPGDLVVGSTPGAALNEKDPLGLGL